MGLVGVVSVGSGNEGGLFLFGGLRVSMLVGQVLEGSDQFDHLASYELKPLLNL
jgi:hypothetical protein